MNIWENIPERGNSQGASCENKLKDRQGGQSGRSREQRRSGGGRRSQGGRWPGLRDDDSAVLSKMGEHHTALRWSGCVLKGPQIPAETRLAEREHSGLGGGRGRVGVGGALLTH